MRAMRTVLAVLLVPFMLAGCLVYGHPDGGVVMVPALPPIVVLDAEPYYVHEGYHYHYQNGGWYYAQSRSGPWADLPRDHYPREVRYKDGRSDRDEGQNHGHQGR